MLRFMHNFGIGQFGKVHIFSLINYFDVGFHIFFEKSQQDKKN